MDLKGFVNKSCICILDSVNKKDALLKLVELAGQCGIVDNVNTLAEKIFYREELMSTGIGLGIAIPHVRYEGVKKPAVVIGISREGIPDYKSIDDVIIKIVVMILAGKNQHTEHIQLLSSIVANLKNNDGISTLLSFNSIDDIYSFFIN